MRQAISTIGLLCVVALQACTPVPAPAQTTTTTTPPSAFESTTFNFALTPITLPGSGTTLSGAETDVMVNVSPNNAFGQTTLISSSPFIGGRYERTLPSVAKWIQNNTSLTGGNFQFALTASLGVVDASTHHYGESAGFVLKYAPSGATNFNVAADVEWANLPGIAHNIPKLSIGPNFRF